MVDVVLVVSRFNKQRKRNGGHFLFVEEGIENSLFLNIILKELHSLRKESITIYVSLLNEEKKDRKHPS